jgi:DNA-binding CsgD family transcriptional regulator
VYELIDRPSRIVATLALVGGTGLFLTLELREEPPASALDVILQLVEIVPLMVVAAGVVVLARNVIRQRDEQRLLIRELEVARLQGQRWRTESRALLDGLGHAIEVQFGRWNLTDAEGEVALLLLKGLSLKEIAAVRGTTERTIRTQARALYAKAGLTGRAALSAFFLEDLLAPIGDGPLRALPRG